jgi:hypothetical protein
MPSLRRQVEREAESMTLTSSDGVGASQNGVWLKEVERAELVGRAEPPPVVETFWNSHSL